MLELSRRTPQRRKRWMSRLGVGAALALLCSAQAPSAEASSTAVIGKVSHLEGGGASKKRSQSNDWKRLKAGAPLYQGDSIKTEEGARLEAELKDGSVVRLGPASELNLENASFAKKGVKKFRAKLVVGRVWSAVRSLFGSESKFEVTTVNAVAGVRGTVFSAARTPTGETQVKVYEGQVLVSNEPIYKVKGATKETRQEVPGPQEISRDQWTSLVAGAMQTIRVAQNGDLSPAESFAMATEGEDAEWESWNADRDRVAGFATPKP